MTTCLSAEPTVVVVGGGLAGLSASLQIISDGGRVILVEGEGNTGGNSAKASSGINGAGTETQKNMGITDSPDLLQKDTLTAGDDENDKKLVEILAANSADAVQFLKNVGVDLTDVNLCGGHSVPRTHWIPSPKEGRPIPAGFEIMKRLRTRLNEIQEKDPEAFRLLTQTKMIGIEKRDGRVVGIQTESVADGSKSSVFGNAVVLATGGFSADRSENGLLVEFGGEKLGFPSTNGPFARGDGVKVARSIGAKIIGMDRIQIHPTAFVDPKEPGAGTKFLAAEALRGKGAILINSDGKRFGNELGRRDYLTGRILEHAKPIEEKFQGGSAGKPSAIMLMNEANVDAFGRPAFNFYAIVKKFFSEFWDGCSQLLQEWSPEHFFLLYSQNTVRECIINLAIAIRHFSIRKSAARIRGDINSVKVGNFYATLMQLLCKLYATPILDFIQRLHKVCLKVAQVLNKSCTFFVLILFFFSHTLSLFPSRKRKSNNI
uniref:FAD_binding_2 domain-containing protein n=1 Tax=Caenorhabditis japonica TaxID=281687 RepID=A0A8R1HIF4_CAEJA